MKMSSKSNTATNEVGDEEKLPETSQDLTVFVQNLLEQMVRIILLNSASLISCDPLSNKGSIKCHPQLLEGVSVSMNIVFVPVYMFHFHSVDEMGGRIDDLERSISELMEQVRFLIAYFLYNYHF